MTSTQAVEFLKRVQGHLRQWGQLDAVALVAPLIIADCEWCGRPFVRARIGQLFCSRLCGRRSGFREYDPELMLRNYDDVNVRGGEHTGCVSASRFQ